MASRSGALLSTDFLAQLERLSLRARKPVKGWGAGQRRSRRTGHSVEFADYRAYGSGDDMRYVDWSIYSRTGRMHVKLFVDDEDLCLHLLIDGSTSMQFGSPSKLVWSAKLAAALGFVGLNGQERVGLGVIRERLDAGLPPTRGRNRITAMFDFLKGLRGLGATNLNASLTHYAENVGGAGLAVVVSDFLDTEGYERGLKALLKRGFEIQVLHVLSPEELSPQPGGDVRLVDSESGLTRLLRIDERALAAYQARLHEFLAQVERTCTSLGIGYTRVSSADNVEKFVLGSLRGKVLA